MHPCERCGAPILEKYRVCYLCMRDMQQEGQKGPENAQTLQTVSYPTPTVVCAPSAQETRQKAIQDAHEENILASATLTEAIRWLAQATNDLAHCIREMKR